MKKKTNAITTLRRWISVPFIGVGLLTTTLGALISPDTKWNIKKKEPDRKESSKEES